MSEDFDQLLASAESTLAMLQNAADNATGIALQFGRQIGDVGRALTLHPELSSKASAFVERTAPIVRMDPGIWIWIHRVDDAAESRSSDTEVYMHALKMRSDLEFFRDLYRDSVASDYILGIETDEMDQDLKEWGSHQYIEAIPPGFPDSHTWWHQSLSETPRR